MKDYTRMGYVGLTDRELNVLSSMFTLAPQLKETYRLTDPDQIHNADVLLVNADDPTAVEEWNEITRTNKLATSLMLSTCGKVIDGIVTLKRPIRIHKLIGALEDVTKARNANRPPNRESELALRVLVVDDSYPVRKYMEHKLAELTDIPLSLSFAASGEEAKILVRQKVYDMIFLDVVMQGVDGYQVCKAIKAMHVAYVVMLTSKKSPFDRVRGTMSGCDAYITKPPSDQRLIEEIQKCVKRRSKVQHIFNGTGGAVSH